MRVVLIVVSFERVRPKMEGNISKITDETLKEARLRVSVCFFVVVDFLIR